MYTRVVFGLTPLLLAPLPNKFSPVISRSPQQTTSKRCHVLSLQASATLPKKEKDSKKRVVITGMGLVSVFGNDVDTFYNRLLAGENGISLIDKFDTSSLPVHFGGQIRGFKSDGYIEEKLDQRLDDCQRYCIVAGKKALENAGLSLIERSKMNKERQGVLIGSSNGGVSVFSEAVESVTKSGYRKINPSFIPYYITNSGPALLAIDLGFMGPNYSISTACATSNYCICAAANHIREGEVDLVIAGGVDACIIPFGVAGLAATTALSRRNDDPKSASRPWDKQRDGFVIGEGAGVLVMESLEHAMKRDAPILAEYLGGSMNCDAYHITNPRPNGFGISSCIQSSIANANLSIEEVNYVNAHATSTVAGDLAEIKALKKIFKRTDRIKVNATKSMIGHSLGAAGGLEAIATIKAIQTGWLHPTINQYNLECTMEFDTVAHQKQQYEIDVAISNSFGFGGHNSVVVFSAFKP